LIRVGEEPNTALFSGRIDMDEAGFILTDGNCETNLPCVFAVGDVANPLAPTISSAVGAGATAAKVIAARIHPAGLTISQ
jgi:thioredoxin reductase (NADPH)